jgi:hypothetical protein
VVVVSGTLESVDKAGRKSELAYQLAKRGSELKRDIETTLTGNSIATPGSDTVARTTAGFESFMLAANSVRGT